MKSKKSVYIFASALAGAYFFLIVGLFSVFFPLRVAFAQSHPKEKLASYTTYFSREVGGRCENIRLAAARLDGIALQPYGEFSFNGAVGPRTAENGYQTAKVIVRGEFVDGIGGGVCQVSTTLYNAALLSGLTVLEYHAHSLRVGYVPPSRDAMVTAYSDLRLYNPHAETVYIRSVVGEGYLRITLYGKSDGNEYSIESRTLAEIPPPAPPAPSQDPSPNPSQDQTQGEILVRPPSNGIKSESYLKTYRNGVLLRIERLRTDEYAPQGAIIQKKLEKR